MTFHIRLHRGGCMDPRAEGWEPCPTCGAKPEPPALLPKSEDRVSDPRTSQFLPDDAVTVIELLKRVGGEPDLWSAEERRAVMRLAATRPQGAPA